MNDHPRTCPNCGDDWSSKHPDAPSFSCPACPWPWVNDPDTGFYRPNADPVRIVAKALSTVGGYVWCGRGGHEQPRPSRHGDPNRMPEWTVPPCPGPHRTLLLGPEVDSDALGVR